MSEQVLDLTNGSLEKKWIEDITSQLETVGESPNIHKGGILGYCMDMMARHIISTNNEVVENNKEVHIETARKQSTIYTKAFSKNIGGIFGKASSMEFTISLTLKEIIEKSLHVADASYDLCRLNEYTTFTVDGYPFILDYPINLYVRKIGNDYSVTASYDMTEDNPLSDIENVSIKSKIVPGTSGQAILLLVKGRQLSSNKFNKVTTIKDVASFELQGAYSDNLADIIVRVDGVRVPCLYKHSVAPREYIKYATYDMSDELVTIYFTKKPKIYYPGPNVDIELELITTKGTLGNFKFAGSECDIALHQDDSNIYEDSIVEVKIESNVISSESFGGVDKLTTEELRHEIIRIDSTNNTMITEQDFVKEFKDDSGYDIVTIRDDIIRREYMMSGKVIGTDGKSVVQTRNGHIYVHETDLNEMYGVQALYPDISSVYQLAEGSNTALEFSNELTNLYRGHSFTNLADIYEGGKDLLLTCPFLIRINKDPSYIDMYSTYIDEKNTLQFVYNNVNVPEKFAMSKINIHRLDPRINKYDLDITVGISDSMVDRLAMQDISGVPFKVRCVIVDDETESPLCRFDMIPDMSTLDTASLALQYKMELTTNNVLHQDGLINITNPNTELIPMSRNEYITDSVDGKGFLIPFKSQMKIYIVYKPESTINSSVGLNVMTEEEINTGYIVSDISSTFERVPFLKDMSSMFAPIIKYNVVSAPNAIYEADVPLRYTEPVYQRDEHGEYVYVQEVNPDDVNGELIPTDMIIEHDIGDIVKREDGTTVFEHSAGDPIILNGEVQKVLGTEDTLLYQINNIPLVSLFNMMDPIYRKEIYESFDTIDKKIRSLSLPNRQNYFIRLKVFNTVGPSTNFDYGTTDNMERIDRLDVSPKFYVKTRYEQQMTEELLTDIRKAIQEYIENVNETMTANLISCANHVSKTFTEYIEYMEYGGLGRTKDPSKQTIKLSDDSDMVTTPEYITIRQKLDLVTFRYDGTVVTTPDIDIEYIIT